VPPAVLLLGTNAVLHAAITLECVEHQAPNQGEVLCAVFPVDPAVVLPERHVQTPVKLVLHRPVVADQLDCPRRAQLLLTADVHVRERLDLVAALSRPLDHHYAPQTRPASSLCAVLDVVHDPGLAHLAPPVPTLLRASVVVRRPLAPRVQQVL